MKADKPRRPGKAVVAPVLFLALCAFITINSLRKEDRLRIEGKETTKEEFVQVFCKEVNKLFLDSAEGRCDDFEEKSNRLKGMAREIGRFASKNTYSQLTGDLSDFVAECDKLNRLGFEDLNRRDSLTRKISEIQNRIIQVHAIKLLVGP